MKTKTSLFSMLLLSSLIFILPTGCEESGSAKKDLNFENEYKAAPIVSRGSALAFDGIDDYVVVPDNESLDMTTGFTISAWVYLEAYTEWASIMTKGGAPDGSSDDNSYTIHQTGPYNDSDYGRFRFTHSSPGLPIFLESNTQIPLHEWHHIAITYDGEYLTYYLNGEEDGGGLLPGPLTPNDNDLFIGVDFPGGDEYWHGAMDEVKLWNVALKKVHVKAAMNGAATPLAKNLAACWRFNEGEGEVAGDKSINANDGVLVNGPTWMPR